MRGWQAYGRSTRDRRRKKQRRAHRPLSEATRPVAQPHTEAARPAASAGGWRAPARQAAVTTIHPEEYSYVYSDLKRIAVLATSIFAILIALTLIIR